jgi:hypothetical protein
MKRLFIVGLLSLAGAAWFFAHESVEVVKTVSAERVASIDATVRAAQ